MEAGFIRWALVKDALKKLARLLLVRHRKKFLLFLLMLWYFRKKMSKVKLFYKPSAASEAIITKANLRSLTFCPFPFLPGGHMQTFLGVAFEKITHNADWGFKYVRKMHTFHDGGKTALDYVLPHANASLTELRELPLLFLVPGISGENYDYYLRNSVVKGIKYGYQVVVVNHRGAEGTKLHAPKLYNAGTSQDLREVVNHLIQENNDGLGGRQRDVYLAGFSMGANLVAKYLGEEGG